MYLHIKGDKMKKDTVEKLKELNGDAERMKA